VKAVSEPARDEDGESDDPPLDDRRDGGEFRITATYRP
jgi:hypothetical protein